MEYKEIRYVKEFDDGSGVEYSVTVSKHRVQIENIGYTIDINDKDVLWFIQSIINASNELSVLEPQKDETNE